MKMHIITVGALISLGLTGCGNSQHGGDTSQAQTASQLLQMMGPPLDNIESQPSLAEQFSCGNQGVEICHLPPGNPANAHTLCIGAPAVAHHLKEHKRGELGDYLGACVSSSDGGGSSSGGTTSGGTDGTGSTGGTDGTSGSGSTGGTSGSSGGTTYVDCTAPGAYTNPICQ